MGSTRYVRVLLLIAVIALGAAPAAALGAGAPYEDPSLPVSERVADLLSR